jgi:hypothetical protein
LTKLDLKELVENYLKVFESQDLPNCLEFFDDDASINFAVGVYRGKQAIEEWHKDRIKARFKIVKMENFETCDDKITVHAVAVSKKLEAWGIDSVSGKATFQVLNGKFKEVHLDLLESNPLQGIVK